MSVNDTANEALLLHNQFEGFKLLLVAALLGLAFVMAVLVVIGGFAVIWKLGEQHAECTTCVKTESGWSCSDCSLVFSDKE